MTIQLKNFKAYLSESAKTYTFRIKIAGNISPTQEKEMQAVLSKFKVADFKTVGTTPIQAFPLDFPKIKFSEVCIYDVVLNYPVTQWEIHELLSTIMGISKDAIVVRSPNEALEEYQKPQEKRTGALLSTPDYKELVNAEFDEYYGDKYNSGFIKELNDVLKLQRKARGEIIPCAGPAAFNTDSPGNTSSNLKQAQDPRK